MTIGGGGGGDAVEGTDRFEDVAAVFVAMEESVVLVTDFFSVDILLGGVGVEVGVEFVEDLNEWL